jgi:glucose-1-phosphatase
MTITAVIFDLGGVLVRTEDRGPREGLASRLNMTYAELNDLVFDSESAQMATRGLMTTEEHWGSIRSTLGLSQSEFSIVPTDFWGGDVVDTDLVNYIRSLRPEFKTALLSNAWDDLRQALKNNLKILDAFDETVISAEVGVAKPDPRIFQITLERLGAAAQETIFVDDFVENVVAAQQLGFHVIHFRNPDQTRAEIDKALGRM